MRARARAIAKAGGSLEQALAAGLPKLVEVLVVGSAGARSAEAGRPQILRYFRPRLDRSRQCAARLRGRGRYPDDQLPQRGRNGACRDGIALAIRRTLRGGHVDRAGCDAGLCWLARRRIERRRRLSHLRRRNDLRRRLQHAAGAEGGAGPVRPHDGRHGPILRASHAGRAYATRCAAAVCASIILIVQGRSTFCCRSTRSPQR